jgi:hypothetical protein
LFPYLLPSFSSFPPSFLSSSFLLFSFLPPSLPFFFGAGDGTQGILSAASHPTTELHPHPSLTLSHSLKRKIQVVKVTIILSMQKKKKTQKGIYKNNSSFSVWHHE